MTPFGAVVEALDRRVRGWWGGTFAKVLRELKHRWVQHIEQYRRRGTSTTTPASATTKGSITAHTNRHACNGKPSQGMYCATQPRVLPHLKERGDHVAVPGAAGPTTATRHGVMGKADPMRLLLTLVRLLYPRTALVHAQRATRRRRTSCEAPLAMMEVECLELGCATKNTNQKIQCTGVDGKPVVTAQLGKRHWKPPCHLVATKLA